MTLITLATWYLYAGAVVAVIFLPFGLSRLDENAQGAWIFRPLLVPGVLLIWPLVLWRCIIIWRGENRLSRHQMPRHAQDWVCLLMIVGIPLILVTALAVRQDPDALAPPVLLEAAK